MIGEINFKYYSRNHSGTAYFKGRYGKVKSTSHNETAHLHSPNNVPIKYELPTLYIYSDIAWNQILKAKVTTVRSKVNEMSHQDNTHLHSKYMILSSISPDKINNLELVNCCGEKTNNHLNQVSDLQHYFLYIQRSVSRFLDY